MQIGFFLGTGGWTTAVLQKKEGRKCHATNIKPILIITKGRRMRDLQSKDTAHLSGIEGKIGLEGMNQRTRQFGHMKTIMPRLTRTFCHGKGWLQVGDASPRLKRSKRTTSSGISLSSLSQSHVLSVWLSIGSAFATALEIWCAFTATTTSFVGMYAGGRRDKTIIGGSSAICSGYGKLASLLGPGTGHGAKRARSVNDSFLGSLQPRLAIRWERAHFWDSSGLSSGDNVCEGSGAIEAEECAEGVRGDEEKKFVLVTGIPRNQFWAIKGVRRVR